MTRRLLLFGLLLMLSVVILSGNAYAWLDGWDYRRPITIDNSGSTELTDFQVRIDLDSSNFDFSKAASDGADIRMAIPARVATISNPNSTSLTDYQVKIEDPLIRKGDHYRVWTTDPSNPIPYWIEDDGIMWVKVTIPANGSVQVYYARDPSAPAPDGDSVFEFFDDFEGTALDTSKWIEDSADGTVTVQDGYVRISYSASGGATSIISQVSFSGAFVYEIVGRWSEDGANTGEQAPSILHNEAQSGGAVSGSEAIAFFCVDGDIRTAYYDGSAWSATTGLGTISLGEWYRFKIVSDGTKYDYYVYASDGTLLAHDSDAANFTGYIVLRASSQPTSADYDVVIVRKYAEQEPTVTVSDATDVTFEWLLPYWIEKWDSANEQATIWVKVPSIPANGSTTIYMYYGNASATDASDGDVVFEFFDDFDGTALDTSKWNANGDGISVADGVVTIGDSDTTTDQIYTATTYASPLIVTGLVYSDGNAMNFGWSNAPDGGDDAVVWYQYPTTGTTELLSKVDGTLTWVDTGILYTGWHVVKLVWTSSSVAMYIDDTQVASTTAVPSDAMPVQAADWSSSAILKIDWVFVRKYADPEPTTSIGAEETASGISVSVFRFPTAAEDLALDPENNVTTITVEYNAVLTKNSITVTYYRAYDGDSNTTILEGTDDVNYITFSRTYDSVGDYNTCVYVKAVDDQNNEYEDTACDVVHIDEYPQGVGFDWNNHIPFPSETLEFTGTATDNGTITYLWDFGDSATDSGQTVQHAYSSTGAYTVTMTVTDDVGLSKSVSKSVAVYSAPTFVMSPNPTIEMDPVTFTHYVDNRLSYTCAIYGSDGNVVGDCNATYYPPPVTGALQRMDNITVEYHLSDDQNNTRDYNATGALTVDQLIMGECNTTISTLLIEANILDEITREQVTDPFTVSIDLQYWSDNNEFRKHFGVVEDNITEFNLCVYPPYATPHLDGRIDYSSTNYPLRSYLYHNALISTLPQQLDLYTLALTSGQYYTVYVAYLGKYVDGARIAVLRYYPDLGAYLNVAQGETDYEGKHVFFLRPADAWYKFVVTYGDITQEFGPTTITGTTTVLTLNSDGAGRFDTILSTVQVDCQYVEETNALKCTYTDPTGKVVSAKLVVLRETLLSSTEYNSIEISGPSGSFVVTLDLDYSYYYYLYVRVGDEWYQAKSGYLPLSSDIGPYGIEGPVLAMIVTLAVAAVGYFAPLAAVVFAVIGIVISVGLRLISVSIGAIVGLLAAGIIAVLRRGK